MFGWCLLHAIGVLRDVALRGARAGRYGSVRNARGRHACGGPSYSDSIRAKHEDQEPSQ